MLARSCALCLHQFDDFAGIGVVAEHQLEIVDVLADDLPEAALVGVGQVDSVATQVRDARQDAVRSRAFCDGIMKSLIAQGDTT